MNGNPMLGQILGSVLGQAMARRTSGRGGFGGGFGGGGLGGLGGGLGGAALGGILAGALGRGRGGLGRARAGGNHTALLLMMLPLAMRWVQRNGGMGAVLKRFQQQGYEKQAKSWMATGANDGIDDQAVQRVVGQPDLDAMAQRLGVPPEQVAQAFAEIMPEMVDKLTPQGELPPQADDVLEDGRVVIEREIEDAEAKEPTGR